MSSFGDPAAASSTSKTKPLEPTNQIATSTWTSDHLLKHEGASGTLPSTETSELQRPASQIEQSASISKSQTPPLSVQDSPVKSSDNQDVKSNVLARPNKLDIKDSEDIPDSVAGVLNKWFEANAAKAPQGAVTRAYAENAFWVPSRARMVRYEDKDGRKLESQLYSLQKKGWIRNKGTLILIVWNDFQWPVIIKGVVRIRALNSERLLMRKLPCRAWKGEGDDINKNGFARSPFIFMVVQTGLRCDSDAAAMESHLPNQTGGATIPSSTLARMSPAPPLSPKSRNSGPTDAAIARTDSRQMLGKLPSGLRVLLEQYYADNGIEEPPVCASDEDLEPATSATGEPVEFWDFMKRDVIVERFATGFEGRVFLVVEGKAVIKHSGSNFVPREYVRWCGGRVFRCMATFMSNVASVVESGKDKNCDKSPISSRQVATTFGEHPSRKSPFEGPITPDFLTTYCTDRGISSPSTTQTRASPAPVTKRSPRTYINLAQLREQDHGTGQTKRQKLDHPIWPRDSVSCSVQNPSCWNVQTSEELDGSLGERYRGNIGRSQAASGFQRTFFDQSKPAGSSERQPSLATVSQRESSQPRGPLHDTSPHVRNPPRTANMSFTDNVEVRFISANGSIVRRRLFKLCNKVARLFNQATIAFGWPGSSGKILVIRIPGIKESCAIPDGDKADFDHVVRLLADTNTKHVKERHGENSAVEVSEFRENDDG